jgi:hypothetical protein
MSLPALMAATVQGFGQQQQQQQREGCEGVLVCKAVILACLDGSNCAGCLGIMQQQQQQQQQQQK